MAPPDAACGDAGDPKEVLSVDVVRDMVVDCFAATHGQRFSAHRVELGMDAGEGAIRESVEGIVRIAFRQVGGDFDNPTTRDLARVVTLLAERSLEWGVPEDTVFEHHSTMIREIGRMMATA